MPDLEEKTEDGQPLEPEKAKELFKKLEGWQFSSDSKKILRNIEFKSFREAADFIISLAGFSEKIGHYPDFITIRCQKVTIELTTRQVKGLSEKDFILAEEIDALAGWKKRLEQWLVSPRVLIPLLILLLLLILWQRLG